MVGYLYVAFKWIRSHSEYELMLIRSGPEMKLSKIEVELTVGLACRAVGSPPAERQWSGGYHSFNCKHNTR
jgi:hypothetical protein